MDHSAVNSAVIDAVRSFGPPYEGPVESAAVNHAGQDRYTAVFNDTRKSRSSGPSFGCDILVTADSTHETVRDYVKSRIEEYFNGNPN